MMKSVFIILVVLFVPLVLPAQDEAQNEDIVETVVPAPSLREKAVNILTDVIILARSKDNKLINKSVTALGDYGDPAVLPILWGRYKITDDNEAKVLALEAIGKLGSREQITQLRNVFEGVDTFKTADNLKYKPPSVAAGIALLSLRDRSGIVEMNKYLQGRDRQLQMRALQAFGYTEEDTSLHVLVELLREKEDSVRESAVKTLDKIAKSGYPYVVSRLEPLLKDNNRKIRVSAAKVLGKLGSGSAKDVLKEELKDNKYQPDILKILYKLGEKEKSLKLVELLSEDLNEDERKKTEEVLIDLKDKSVNGSLLELLRDSEVKATLSAIRILGALRVEKAIELLIRLMKHDEEEIQDAAVKALGIIGSNRALLALSAVYDRLREAEIFETRKKEFQDKVAIALGNLGEKTGFNHFLTKNRVSGKTVVEAGLADIEHKNVFPVMIKVLRDPDSIIQTSAFARILEVLEEYQSDEVILILVKMLQERKTNGKIRMLAGEETISIIRFIAARGSIVEANALKYLLEDSEMRVRVEAAIAILRLVPEKKMEEDD